MPPSHHAAAARPATAAADPARRAGLGATWRRAFALQPPTLNLALQGGGAHGAFTWGVLDALAAADGLGFEGLSGSSAGALNAVLFAEGWRRDGRDGARAALAQFWLALGDKLRFDLLVQGQGEATSLSSAGRLLFKWAGQFTPEQLNPLDLNLLRDLLVEQIDFEALRRASPFKLFVGATQANTGRLRLFRESEIGVDVLLASACLPRLHRTVTIAGEPYWDGGYAANPAVFPLFYDCASRDVMLVLLSPLRHGSTPQSVEEIEQRAAEIAFSANLMREMRSFVHAGDFARASWWPAGALERRLRDARFHLIDAQDLKSVERSETKLIAHRPFLELLRDQGRQRAEAWLQAHRDAIGRRCSVDLRGLFG